MDVHTIRLRAPWQISDRAGDLPTTPSGGEPLRLLPQAQGQAAERATLVRQFNCPTHLGQARVRLKLDIDAATVRATAHESR